MLFPDAVITQFPGTSPSEIRMILRRKCNNEAYSERAQESGKKNFGAVKTIV